MRRIIFIVALLPLFKEYKAQETNLELNSKFKQNNENLVSEFEVYKNTNKPPKLAESLESKVASVIYEENVKNEHNVAFFIEGRPYFMELLDTDQNKNANIDLIQEGKVEGLSKAYNGEEINISVFDGGSAFERHSDFLLKDDKSRITNMEQEIQYDAHATGVTGMIGAKGTEITNAERTIRGNTRGVLPMATFNNYSFSSSKIKGADDEKNVFQKLLISKAYLSNHSYGIPVGWRFVDLGGFNAWFWTDYYDPNEKKYYDLQGVYNNQDKFYDDIVYNNPEMTIVKSAGNSFGLGSEDYGIPFYIYRAGNGLALFNQDDNIPEANCERGYDCIGPGSLAKNIIVVGATEKITSNDKRYIQSSDVKKADYSSAGPRDDGGIKPDIAGVGSNVFFPSVTKRDGMYVEAYGAGNGTSFSSPNITGIIGLWMQIYKDLFKSTEALKASATKTLLIHSAQDAGNEGPDPWYGWGFADAKKGAELLVEKSNGRVIFEDKSLNNNAKNEFFVETKGGKELKATISWIDPSYKDIATTYDKLHNNRTSVLVNDLDLKLTHVKSGKEYYPFKLNIEDPMAPAITGDNTVDNVEQVLIKTPDPGIYKVEISHKGTLRNNTGDTKQQQEYSILISGYDKIPLVTDTMERVYLESTLVSSSIKFVNSHLITSEVKIYDMSGRLIKTIVGDFSSDINISGLSKGVYIASVETKNGLNSIKFIKQ